MLPWRRESRSSHKGAIVLFGSAVLGNATLLKNPLPNVLSILRNPLLLIVNIVLLLPKYGNVKPMGTLFCELSSVPVTVDTVPVWLMSSSGFWQALTTYDAVPQLVLSPL